MPVTFFFFLPIHATDESVYSSKKMYIAISSVESLVTTPLLQPAVT